MKSGYAPSHDGTQIYYEVHGSGPALMAANGFVVSTFFWEPLRDYFKKTHTVILWDYRGHGKSGAPKRFSTCSMENNAKDMVTVMDAAGVSQAVLFGHSMGVQVILETYRQFPDRVAGLVPVLGSWGHPLDTFMDSDAMAKVFPLIYYFAMFQPKLMQRLVQGMTWFPVAFPAAKLMGLVNRHHIQAEDIRTYLEHLSSLDARMVFSMLRHVQAHSVKDILGKIKAPTLIVAGQDDIFTPWWISDQMRRMIPGAEMLTVPRGSHAALVEQPELMCLRIEKFLLERLKGTPWEAAKAPKKQARPAAKKTPQKAAKKKAAPAKPKGKIALAKKVEKKKAPPKAAADTPAPIKTKEEAPAKKAAETKVKATRAKKTASQKKSGKKALTQKKVPVKKQAPAAKSKAAPATKTPEPAQKPLFPKDEKPAKNVAVKKKPVKADQKEAARAKPKPAETKTAPPAKTVKPSPSAPEAVYEPVEKGMRPAAHEAASVIDYMRSRGYSLAKIAGELNSRGVPTKSGRGQWNASSVNRVLKASENKSGK